MLGRARPTLRHSRPAPSRVSGPARSSLGAASLDAALGNGRRALAYNGSWQLGSSRGSTGRLPSARGRRKAWAESAWAPRAAPAAGPSRGCTPAGWVPKGPGAPRPSPLPPRAAGGRRCPSSPGVTDPKARSGLTGRPFPRAGVHPSGPGAGSPLHWGLHPPLPSRAPTGCLYFWC